jgi:hypothetical protein
MSDLKLISVKDATIADIQSEMAYTVKSGASSTTYTSYDASSFTSSTCNWSIPVPSESIVCDRAIKLRSTFGVQFQLTHMPVVQGGATRVFDYGKSFSLQAFPISSCMNSLTCQMNTTQLSCQVKDVLPILLRLTDRQSLEAYNSGCPSQPDVGYGQYKDMLNTNSNVMSTMNNAGFNNYLTPRGAHQLKQMTIMRTPAGGGQPVAENVSQNLDDVFTISLEFETYEPLFLSPFLAHDPSTAGGGLLGVNNLTFVAQFDAEFNRMFSQGVYQTTAPAGEKYLFNVRMGFTGNNNVFSKAPSLTTRFLSLQPTDRVETTNVLPMLEYPMFAKIQAVALPAWVVGQPPASIKLTSNSISLAIIPDTIVICCRKPMQSQKWGDTSSFLGISELSIQFNNSAGLLSGANAYDLWQMSRKNGSNQSFAEFSGFAFDNNATAGNTQGNNIPTTGSLVVISPAYDLSLPAFLSSGSMGQFSFQVQLTAFNQFQSQLQDVEICIMCINSGMLVTQAGMSSTSSGMLNRDMVLNTAQMESVPSSAVHSLVGGKLHSSHGAALAKLVRHHLRKVSTGGSIAGMAASGSRVSGGGLSGLY